VILVDYRGVGPSGGEMPDSIPAPAADIIAFVKARPEGNRSVRFIDLRHGRAAGDA
jgi:pimeloyl-ACP methyl ester carboxylesterase